MLKFILIWYLIQLITTDKPKVSAPCTVVYCLKCKGGLSDCENCQAGYYLQSPKTCTVCPKTCTLCQSNTYCTSCASGYNLQGSTCILACTKPCSTCSGSVTNCATCIDAHQIPPSCNCNSGYLINVTTKMCDPCTFPCATCQTTLIRCLSCASTYTYDSINQKCQCQTNQYEQSGNPKTCQLCKSPCLTCSTITQCNSCVSGINRYLNINSCICDNGFYDDGQICQPCVKPCINCSQLYVCTSCVDALQTIPNCQCQNKYYSDQQFICQPCQSPCNDCSSPTNCTSCSDTFYLLATVTPNTCISCISPCNNCISASTCTSCIADYLLQQSICIPCSRPCKDCFGSVTTCTSCIDQNQTTPNCDCISEYFMDSITKLCLRCIYPCQTCINTETNCQSCAPTYTLLNNTCICQTSEYEDWGSLSSCQACLSPCQTCITSSTRCLSCISGLNRHLKSGTNLCVCDNGYYDSGGVCNTCMAACLFCTNATTCDCKENNYIDSSSICQPCQSPCYSCITNAQICTQCVDNYYLIGSSCYLCSKPCQNCLDSATKCTSCAQTNQLVYNDTCNCPYGQYMDQSFICQQCTYPCQNCKNQPTQCLSCAVSYILSNNSCLCLDGFYLDLTSNPSQCQQCISPCKTCTDSVQCVTCIDGNQMVNSSNQCVCKSGFIFINNICDQCLNPCIECSGNTNNCTQCKDSHHQLNNGKCICEDGWLNDANYDCKPCISPCKACSTNTIHCDSCTDINQYINTLSQCYCKDKYYSDSISTCKECAETCATCDKNGCLTCLDPTQTINTNLQCICQNGYFVDNGYCLKCQLPCQNCISLTECDSCADSLQILILNTCTCPSGQYMLNYYCEFCQLPCITCEIRANYCTSCTDPNHIILNNQCTCKIGYVDADDTGMTCEPCDYPCVNCVDRTTTCTECIDSGQYKLQNGQCICQQGFFLYANQCYQCSPQCNECLYQPDFCLNCSDLNHLFYQNECFCRPGFYWSTSMTCLECESPCATCLYNYDYCTSCIGDKQDLIDNTCICPDGYYFNGTNCFKCEKKCSKCTAFDKCTECNTGYYLYQDLCDNYCLDPCQTCTIPIYCTSCIEGYFLDYNGICIQCNQNCQLCTDSHTCDKCYDGYFYQNNNCIKCNKNCLTCVDQGDHCLSCKGDEDLIVNKCYCNSKSTTDSCIKCQFPCLICSDSNICVQCRQLDGLYLNSESQCVCQNEYIWQDNICSKICNKYCLQCQDGICLECQENYILNDNKCSQTQPCGNGLIDDNEKCDDSNTNPNDGCYQCQIEDNWFCNTEIPSQCTYYQPPYLILSYLNLTSQIQYVQLEFSQKVRINTIQKLSQTITYNLVNIPEESYNISVYSIKEAIMDDINFAKYQFSIEIYTQLNDKPVLNITLNQDVFNEYDISIEMTQAQIQLKIPQYLSPSLKQKAQAAAETNQNIIYGLGALSLLSLFIGEAVYFQDILRLLQYQSYLKFINLNYPENLLIFFTSTNIVSVSSILKYTNLNYYLTKYSLKQGPINTNGKFAFYKYDADLITNLSCQFIQFIGLVFVAFITINLQRKFYNQKTIYKYLQWMLDLNNKYEGPKTFDILKLVNNLINSLFKIAKQFSKQGLRTLFLINSQDLIFKAMIYVHYMQLDSIRNLIQAIFALIIIASYISLIFFTLYKFTNHKQQLHFDVILLSKQMIFIGLIVFAQQNQIIQTLLITFTNIIFFILIKSNKSIRIFFNFIPQFIEVLVIFYMISTFFYFDDFSQYFSEGFKTSCGWVQIILLCLCLLLEASKFLIAKSQFIIDYIKKKINEWRNKNK